MIQKYSWHKLDFCMCIHDTNLLCTKMGCIMKRKIFIILIVCMIILFTIMPTIVSEGAKDGLLLWFMAIVPSLLPFMILSNILIKLKVTKYINRFLKPVFSFIFGVSAEGSYPIIIGFLAGCPVGAKTTAQLYKNKDIKREEAQYLISFCNNLSPMFLIEFIGVKCLCLKSPFLVFVVIAASSVINAWLFRLTGKIDFGKKVKQSVSVKVKESIRKHDTKNDSNEKKYPIMEAVDESIGDSCETILKIGGYIILFSIITSIIEYVIPERYKIIGCVAAGITEVSTGAMQLAKIKILKHSLFFITDIKIWTVIALCAFGGISSVAQTYSVISETDLSIKDYVSAKVRQAFIAVVLALLVFRI